MTTADNLQRYRNSIPEMEKNILYRNPHLKTIFSGMHRLFAEPVVISQISFAKKTQVDNHILFTGDAAGMIAPLCGNGMSMALHAGKIAASQISQFLDGSCSRKEMEDHYRREWNDKFSARLRTGRMIQSLFGRPLTTNLFIRTLKPFPSITNLLIKQTHGEPF